jgi:hypothetical protein
MSVELSEVERLRKRLGMMPDAELLQYCDAARIVCAAKNPRKAFEVQLKEARAEWLRRHPKQR